MRTTKITKGAFVKNEDGEFTGNFTGYNDAGERIFIHKRTMEEFGITKDEQLRVNGKFSPLFAIIGEKEFNGRGKDGEIDTTVVKKRLQAMSVFKTREDAIDALNSDTLLAIDAQEQITKAVSSAGLTKAQLDAILQASI